MAKPASVPDPVEEERPERVTTPAPAGPVSGWVGTSTRVQMDLTVPLRTALVAPPDLELRIAFLLLHVDGRASLGEIAKATQLSLSDVVASFVELTAHGLVELGPPTR